MITITVINDYQCLIYEEEFDTNEPNEALKLLLKENISIAIGDVIKIR